MGEKGKNYRGDRITEFTLEKSTNIFVRMLVSECGPGDLGSEVCTLTSILVRYTIEQGHCQLGTVDKDSAVVKITLRMNQ